MSITENHPSIQKKRMSRVKSPAGFTLIELLVVISIIALLIALLLPALARAKSLALQIQCASNMRQIGIAMQEYANEYRGMYPPTNTGNYPFGGFNDDYSGTWTTYPTWGFGLLYYDSFGIQSNTLVNPRPGILTPNVQGISLMYSTQPGEYSQTKWFPSSDYNSNGIAINWSNSQSGYCYWLDRDKDKYSPGEDVASVWLEKQGYTPTTFVGTFIYTPAFYGSEHVPAENPRSNPGSILVTDDVFLQDLTGQEGLANWATGPGGGPTSNHVETNNNFLPEGAHELYNDGAVVWQSMSQIKPRMIIQTGRIMGW